jgi:ABC-type branched-subunit amino acid transport system ATPase component/ABC-type branched-subunit amino acid transport system permease subunit
MQYYVSTILVYCAVWIIGAWGLNFQFGVAGILNFGFIVTVAAGAYVAAVMTLGAPAHGSLSFVTQQYVFGAKLPYPLPLLCGAVAGMIVGGAMGLVSLRRIRSDYQAITTLIMSLIATDLVTNEIGWFNGSLGITNIPNPTSGLAHGSPRAERWDYVILSAVVLLICGLLIWRLMHSPLGRALRGLRDNGDALAAFGRNEGWLRVLTFLVGGLFGGISGALLVQFLGAWNPSSWTYFETFLLVTAIIVGGTGSFWGVAIGAVLLPVIFQEVPGFIPAFSSNQVLVVAVQSLTIGALAIIFLWFRPNGALPERIPRYRPRLAAIGWQSGVGPSGRGGEATTPVPADGETAPHNISGTPVKGTRRTESANGWSGAEEGRRPEFGNGDDAVSELVVRGLSKHFGGVAAVVDASFSALSGQITGVIGPNGAGKSTMVSLISGAVTPDRGSVKLDGRELARRSQREIARTGVLRTFQLGGEFGRMSALENILIGARVTDPESVWEALAGGRRWRRKETPLVHRAVGLLKDFGLTDKMDAPVGKLSGGERRLVELARILIANPRVILLDEPTTGVHDVMVGRLERHISEVANNNVIVVIIEHELGLVSRICDRVVMMANGRVLRQASCLDELREDREVVAAYFGKAG